MLQPLRSLFTFFASKRALQLVFLFALLMIPVPTFSQSKFVDHWLDAVNRTQDEQPHWISPLILNTPRLEQKLRADFSRQILPGHATTWSYGNGKGLDLIPYKNIALILDAPPYLQHSAPNTHDGLGDVSFLIKYRILAANEEHGNYILSAYLGGSVPTGTYANGSNSAQILPTLAGGKGWGNFSLQSTLGGTLPVDSTRVVGRSIVWNASAQLHILQYLWPELGSNNTYYLGGINDGKSLNFVTPGLILGRIPLRHRMGLSLGAGMQIAVSHAPQYNHALILSGRLPF